MNGCLSGLIHEANHDGSKFISKIGVGLAVYFIIFDDVENFVECNLRTLGMKQGVDEFDRRYAVEDCGAYGFGVSAHVNECCSCSV